MKNTVHVQRAIHKMTQADLSVAIGVSRQTINSIEKNTVCAFNSFGIENCPVI